MRIKEVGYIVERLADRFRDLGGQMAAQEAAHKTALEELRAVFNALTASDEHRLENLREEIIRLNDANGRLVVERDTLREEVAHLKTQLKSQTPKHPVKVGEWVRRLTGFNTTPAGEVARVTLVDDDDPSQLEYEVVRPNGQKGRWSAKGCEPCDSPEATAKLAPKVGDTVRLVTHPDRAKVAEHLQLALQWPWIDRWGVVGQTGKVVKPLVAVAGAVAVALADSTVFARWPIDCLEVVAEATHDTEAGKAAAESAVKTEPVAEEIKMGDVAKVVGASGDITAQSDIGEIGEVLQLDSMDGTVLLSGGAGWVNRCDVRKVTT